MSTGLVLSATVDVPPAAAAPPLSRPVIGIDIAKKLCDLVLMVSPDAEPVHVRVPHAETAAAVTQLVPAGPVTVAMEYTGGLSLPVLQALEKIERVTLLVAQDTDTAALRALLRRPRKTDKLDAQLIARLLHLSQVPETEALTRDYLRLWSVIKGAILARRNVRDLQALVRDRTRLKLRAKRLAADSANLERHTKLIASYGEHIAEAEAALLKDPSTEVRLLASLPGITVRRATILLSAIGDVSRFPSPDHLVRYLGLVPPHRPMSGDKPVAPPKARRQSDLLVSEFHMWGLYLAGHAEQAGSLGRDYERLKAKHDGRVALWHCRRKLIRHCWRILTTGEPWDSAYQRPQKPALTLPGGQR